MSGGDGWPRPSRRILALVILVVVLSALVRIVDLDRFPGLVFDEYYYAHDAIVLLHGDLAGTSATPWKPAAARSAAHPDLAKLAIAAGSAMLGDNAWGRRLPAALAGTALIALVFPLARRLGLSDGWALAALLLAASDPMLMLESRLAVLDMFVAAATVAAVYLALRYVQSDLHLGWLLACGAVLGAAVACKWSGALAGAAVLVVIAPPLVRAGLARRLLAALGLLAAVCMVVYVAASIPYFLGGHGLADWLRLQHYMATFGWGVRGDRAFASRPITWPFDVHPIWYKWALTERGLTGLLAIGNPVLWWSGAVAWVVLAVQAVVRRSWRLGLAPALAGVLYLPWLATTRQTYIYYMVPVIPFIAIVLSVGLARLAGDRRGPAPDVAGAAGPPSSDGSASPAAEGSRRRRRLAAGAFVGVTVVVGLLYIPFVIGFPVPFEYYRLVTPLTTWK